MPKKCKGSPSQCHQPCKSKSEKPKKCNGSPPQRVQWCQELRRQCLQNHLHYMILTGIIMPLVAVFCNFKSFIRMKPKSLGKWFPYFITISMWKSTPKTFWCYKFMGPARRLHLIYNYEFDLFLVCEHLKHFLFWVQIQWKGFESWEALKPIDIIHCNECIIVIIFLIRYKVYFVFLFTTILSSKSIQEYTGQDHTGPYGPTRSHMGPCESLWFLTEPNRTIRA